MSNYIILKSDTIHGVASAKRKIDPITMEIPSWGKPNSNGYWVDPKGKTNQFKQFGPFISNKKDAEKIVYSIKTIAKCQGREVLQVKD